MPKYNNSVRSVNDTDLYKQVLEDRGVKKLTQTRTQYFKNIDKSKIQSTQYVWKKSDNLFKLANRFYNNRNLWWIIAHFNEKPTDAHFEIGEVIYIPPANYYSQL